MTDLTRELALACELSELGAAIALERFRRSPEAWRKSDGTWVTAADTAVEAALRERIAAELPDHDVHGEEEGLPEPRPGAPTWVIDPIDATSNYMAGVPIWATLVALRVDGESVVGAAAAPALGERYDAARRLGARFNGDPIQVDPVERLEDATVVYGLDGTFASCGYGALEEELIGRAARARGFGDFWGHLLVARGAAHAMVEPHRGLSLWDVAALEPIVAEAGGRQTTLDGGPWQPGETLLTTCGGPLHDDILQLAQATAG